MAALLLSYLVPGQLAGKNIQGWLWVMVAAASLWGLAVRHDRIRFPLWLWAPWAGYVLARTFSGYDNAFQSTAQILCSVLVGLAASTYTITPSVLKQVNRWLRWSFYAYVVFFVVRVLPWTLSDIENSGFAAGAITALFFQAYFLCRFLCQGRNWPDLIHYFAALAIPVVSTNRGPILGSLALVLLVAAPLSLLKRIIIAVVAVGIGLAAFYTPRVQYKMFYSGHGTLADLRLDNPDLNTSGRSTMREMLDDGLARRRWVGHGANAAAAELLSAGAVTHELHNDWLRVRYNYGYLGVALFAVTMALQLGLAYWRSQRASPEARVLLCAAASCFVPFAVVMFTDNILVYCQFFTIPHFLCLGFGYAASRPMASTNPTRRRSQRRAAPRRQPSRSGIAHPAAQAAPN
jgi:hypothetical protein